MWIKCYLNRICESKFGRLRMSVGIYSPFLVVLLDLIFDVHSVLTLAMYFCRAVCLIYVIVSIESFEIWISGFLVLLSDSNLLVVSIRWGIMCNAFDVY